MNADHGLNTREPANVSKLIFGCGYLGSRVARHWLDSGESVHAVTRSADRSELLAGEGMLPIIADITQPHTLSELPVADSVLIAVGFDRTSGSSMREIYVAGLRNILNALPPLSGRIIYISSTGVYGQTDGGWVDEQSPCHPTREGGRVSLAAEQVLRDHPLSDRSVILRLAGIYGPRRVPRIDNVLAGEPVPASSTGYLNLIHVEDAARAVIAAEKTAAPESTILISDGHPVSRGEFYSELARLLDAPSPRFVDPPSGSPKAQRASADKRVNNRRMLEQLRVEPAFPSFREGLADIVAARA